jgi:hypothetical protein
MKQITHKVEKLNIFKHSFFINEIPGFKNDFALKKDFKNHDTELTLLIILRSWNEPTGQIANRKRLVCKAK